MVANSPFDHFFEREILTKWNQGLVAVSHGLPVEEFAEKASDIGRRHGVSVDLLIDYQQNKGYARANEGYPPLLDPKSVEGRRWAAHHQNHRITQATWNRLLDLHGSIQR